MKKNNVRERIYLTVDELEQMEIEISNKRHVERYALLRQYCKGNVIDVACGCGYGTYLLSKNPDVTSIIGFDINKTAIDFAQNNFTKENLKYQIEEIKDINVKAETLICLETIEHIKKPDLINEMAERCEIKTIFVSYPSKKTTHYNKHHFHDFNDLDLINIFKNYKLTDTVDLHREVRILKFEK
jgi:2-polyprenyl-3-methyl-5-hydroxy-6-metoxy-1,4-benzoquinol methylase